ncbi:molybdopterin-synthase adenylyltransferase MoeB [Sphingomonas yunnanensis]|uniref:HesA/MoeB/ThiF family protein n=1 Tax=Sphingomonas yunnanensis TaxID=310400 RepID=UPI001CA6E573|nr:molybdopterin-synthase adenylyltransferase MoeB [Sphingomonas yunnanensis]MBY9061370.1 molybdopterin-synthase adenylyltransferase MoeB [Sphingomonas yunnanensis]
MMLSPDELARYARHIVLPEVGGAGQLRLRRARVLVIGAGGIGSPVLHYLGAAGVGRLDVVDDDRVDTSNLQRQTLYTTADLGQAKAEAAAAAVGRLNPHVTVRPLVTRIHAANAASLLDGADAVIDGSDNFDTRLAVADAALASRVPLISAAVGRFEGQIGVFRGWEPDRPCYRCFVGESPQRDGLTCAEEGVLGPVTGVVGSLAALEVIRQLAPFGEDSAGKLVLIDLLALRFRTLSLPKDPGCTACGTGGG